MAIEFKVRNEANCDIDVKVIDKFDMDKLQNEPIASGGTKNFQVENDLSKTGFIGFFVSRSGSGQERELPEHSDPYHGEVIVISRGNLP